MAESSTLGDSLLAWLNTSRLSSQAKDLQQLSDGVLLAEALAHFDHKHFASVAIVSGGGGNFLLKESNLRAILRGIRTYFTEELHRPVPLEVEVSKISRGTDLGETVKLLELVLEVALTSDQSESVVKRITSLPPGQQHHLVPIAKRVNEYMDDSADAADESTALTDVPATPHVLRDVERQLDTARAETAAVTAQLQAAQQQISTLNDELAATQRSVSDLQRQLTDAQLTCDQHRARAEEATTAAEELRAQLRKVETDRRDAADQALRYQESAEQLPMVEAQLQQYRRRIDEFAGLVDELKKAKEENASLYKANLDLDERARLVPSLEAQRDAALRQVADMKGEAEHTQPKMASLHKEVQSLRAERETLEARNRALNAELEGLRKRAEAEAKLAKHDRPPQADWREDDGLQKKVVELETRYKDATDRARALEDEVRQVRAECEAKERGLERLRGDAKQLEDDLTAARTRVRELELSVEDLNQRPRPEPAAPVAAESALAPELERLRGELEQAHRRSRGLEAKLQSETVDRQQLEKDLAEAKKNLRDSTAALESAKKDAAHRETRMKETTEGQQRELGRLRADLEQREQQMRELKQRSESEFRQREGEQQRQNEYLARVVYELGARCGAAQIPAPSAGPLHTTSRAEQRRRDAEARS